MNYDLITALNTVASSNDEAQLVDAAREVLKFLKKFPRAPAIPWMVWRRKQSSTSIGYTPEIGNLSVEHEGENTIIRSCDPARLGRWRVWQVEGSWAMIAIQDFREFHDGDKPGVGPGTNRTIHFNPKSHNIVAVTQVEYPLERRIALNIPYLTQVSFWQSVEYVLTGPQKDRVITMNLFDFSGNVMFWLKSLTGKHYLS